MNKKFKSFSEWIKVRDEEFYKFLVEVDGYGRREFLKKGLGAAAAALAGSSLVKAAEPKISSKSLSEQPAWKTMDLKGPIIEIDKDSFGQKDYNHISVLMKIPSQEKINIRNTNDLQKFCWRFANKNNELGFRVYLMLQKELNNKNITTKNVFIKPTEVTLEPVNYEYNTQDKNVKFVIRVLYFDVQSKEPINIEELATKK